MNERFKELILKVGFPKFDEMYVVTDGKELEKFAELIVQDCAEQIRSNYDHEHAESVAWNLEIEYGLHGDHAE